MGVQHGAGCELHTRRLDGLDSFAEHDLDASILELVLGVLPDVGLEHREQRRPRLDEGQPRLVGGHRAVILREVAAVELAQCPDALDPGGTATDDDHIQGAVVDQRRIAVGRLPAPDEVRPEAQRILDGVERKGVLRGAVAAEELDDRAQPHHEIVVLQRRHVRELHLAAVEVDRRNRRLVDGRVLLVWKRSRSEWATAVVSRSPVASW